MMPTNLLRGVALALATATPAAAQRTLFESVGGAAGDKHGVSLDVLGDLDGDDVRDLVVGAPEADSNGIDSGTVTVLSGATGTVLFTFVGIAAGDEFGRDVATAGDVDGDGICDVLVGAGGAPGTPGYARIFSGANGGLLHTYFGAHAGDEIRAVAGSGDVDADGFSDILIGAPNHNTAGTSAGRVDVRSGLGGAPLHTLLGVAGSQFGAALDFAGEIDGDGRTDFAVGAPLDPVGGPQAGSVLLFSGQTAALTRRFDGAPSDRLGVAVARAGDVDLDGITDVVAGAQQPTGFGYVQVFSGVGGVVLTRSGSAKSQTFGFAAAGAGDVDADGFDDVVVGAPGFDGTFQDMGVARIFRGPTGLLNGAITGAQPAERVGVAVAGGFDGNRDGLADVFVGAPFYAAPAAQAGRALAWSLARGGPALSTFTDPPGATLFGLDVSGVGDVDQDGRPDFAIGSIWDSTGGGNAGSAWIRSGTTGQLLHLFSGDSPHDHLSESIGAAGDVDQDGFADIVTGIPGDDNTATNSGSARVHSGRTGATLYTFDGALAHDLFGWSVDGPGDLDGDGFDDIVVGTFWGDYVRVYSGQTGALLGHIAGVTDTDFGAAVSAAGDTNGDGFPDFLVGAVFASQGGTLNGAAHLYSGGSFGLIRAHGGAFANDWFGASVSGIDDADGDGFDDYAVGATTNASAGVGYARFFSGATGSLLHTVLGDDTEKKLGDQVASAGDWNGDGFGDVLVCAHSASLTQNSTGLVKVISAHDGAVLDVFHGDTPTSYYGSGIDLVGDLNGDGKPEIIVGQNGVARILGQPCAAAEHYGQGCPGSGGHTPRLVVHGCPTAGFDVTLDVFDALGGAGALLLFGAQKAQVPAFGSCDLLVAPLLSAGVPLLLSGAGPAVGVFTASGTLPASASGLTVAAQVFVADIGAPSGVAATNGVRLAP